MCKFSPTFFGTFCSISFSALIKSCIYISNEIRHLLSTVSKTAMFWASSLCHDSFYCLETEVLNFYFKLFLHPKSKNAVCIFVCLFIESLFERGKWIRRGEMARKCTSDKPQKYAINRPLLEIQWKIPMKTPRHNSTNLMPETHFLLRRKKCWKSLFWFLSLNPFFLKKFLEATNVQEGKILRLRFNVFSVRESILKNNFSLPKDKIDLDDALHT